MATGHLSYRMSTRYCMTDTGLLLCEGNTSNAVGYPWFGLINGYPWFGLINGYPWFGLISVYP